LNFPEPTKRCDKFNVFVQFIEGGDLRSGKDQIPASEAVFDMEDEFLEKIEVNERQIFLEA
jgi:hypothetical protein